MIRQIALLAAVLSAFCLHINAQDPKDDDDTIKVDTQLVNVPVAVTSAGGAALRDLKASNFVVYEDGVKQEVSEFASTAAPFEVALLLDTSGSTRNDLQLIQRSAEAFIASLRPGDRVAVVAFATERTETGSAPAVRIISELTGDRAKLSSSLAAVSTSAGTPYYDGLEQIADRIFRQAPTEEFRGRRAIVALTDGVDSTSVAGFDEVKEKLEAKGVVAYFVSVDTREYFEEQLLGDCQTAMRFSAAQIRRYYRTVGGKTASMEKVTAFCQLGDFERLAISKQLYAIALNEMNDLARASGGRVFPVAELSEARTAFKSVASDLGTRYTLGYYPSNDKRDGTARRIKVELKGLPAGSKVRYREGYTAPPR